MLWLTVGEACRYLGVSQPTLRKWTDEGRIAAFRTPGGHRRYLVAALNDFRDAHEQRVDGQPSMDARRRHPA